MLHFNTISKSITEHVNILEELSTAVEAGRAGKDAPYPPGMKGRDGARELTSKALEAGTSPQKILTDALAKAILAAGEKFRSGEIYSRNYLLADSALQAAADVLAPSFASDEVESRGTILVGTVPGNPAPVGASLVTLALESGGWRVVDLGGNAGAEKLLKAAARWPPVAVVVNAMLGDSLQILEEVIRQVKDKYPQTAIIAGGPAVTEQFINDGKADLLLGDPLETLTYINDNFTD